MIIDLKEHLPVIIEKHPFYESINKKLMKQVNSLSFKTPDQLDHYTNIRGGQSAVEPYNETVKLIENWINELIAINLFRNANEPLGKYSFWFSRLNDKKDQYTRNHNHLVNATFGAVYFVNTPKGSSPLVFTTSGKKIKAEEGKVVIFPASLCHKVPQNKSKDRVTLACNICF